MSTTEYVVYFLTRSLSLLPGYTFLIGCFLLWRQTYRISWGHYWYGFLAVMLLLISNVLYTQFHAFAPRFRPLVSFAMTAWVFYNVWYFKKNPKTLKILEEPGRDDLPDYIPSNVIAAKLVSKIEGKPFWFSTTFKWIGVAFFFMLLGSYFIKELAILAVTSDNRVVAVQKAVDTKIAKAKQEAKKEVKAEVAVAVDSLSNRIDTTDAKAAKAFEKGNKLERKVNENESNLQAVGKKASRADAKASRPTMIFVNPATKTQPLNQDDAYQQPARLDSALYAKFQQP